MRIGIITYSDSKDNYGQVLQCWALQTVIKSLGHRPYLIRYKNIKAPRKGKITKKLLKILLVYPAIISIINKRKNLRLQRLIALNEERNKQRKFIDFKNKYIQSFDREYFGVEELRDNPPVADCYITGSDQVWGGSLLNENTKAFFLDFGNPNIPRIAYAASFGTDKYSEDTSDILKMMLRPFTAISVREESGVSICKQCGKKAIMTLDPTLLVPRIDYERLLTDEKEDDYIFIYSLNVFDKKQVNWNNLRKYAKDNHLRIVVTQSSGYIVGDEIFDGVEYRYASIEEWLSLIKHAKFVVTPSFHGIVFSYIFQTPFVFAPILKGQYSQGNNRIYNLCSLLGINPIDASQGYNSSIYSYYKWDIMEKNLNKHINKSMAFLNNIYNELIV